VGVAVGQQTAAGRDRREAFTAALEAARQLVPEAADEEGS
jgi:hypothetical protein